MFGFSRGAYTAKFLARMIHEVGLLCKGNEEMVPFAFILYQRALNIHRAYLEEEAKEKKAAAAKVSQEDDADTDADADEETHLSPSKKKAIENEAILRREIKNFKETFCKVEPRDAKGNIVDPYDTSRKYPDIKVHFLGLWDCVSSVAVLESRSPIPVPVTGTARHVRHAVSVDERRVKFKPALLAQDKQSKGSAKEDVKEVWFAGNHGDVGGGWPASLPSNAIHSSQVNGNSTASSIEDMHITARSETGDFFRTSKPKEDDASIADPTKDAFQLSDIPLAWMIDELEAVKAADEANNGLIFHPQKLKLFKDEFKARQVEAYEGPVHDPLSFSGGCSFGQVLLWKFMGRFPSSSASVNFVD